MSVPAEEYDKAAQSLYRYRGELLAEVERVEDMLRDVIEQSAEAKRAKYLTSEKPR